MSVDVFPITLAFTELFSQKRICLAAFASVLQRLEQFRTSLQHLAHFLRHAKLRPQ